MKILSDSELKKIIRLAIKEDLGNLGDITSNTVLKKRDNSLKFFNSSFWYSNININDGKIDFRN